MLITIDQILVFAGILLGGGVLGTIVASFNSKKVGMKGHENEAQRDINTAWDMIADSFQDQLNNVKNDLKETKEDHSQTRKDLHDTRLELVNTQKTLTETQKELRTTNLLMNSRERINTILLAHVIELEAMIPTPPGPLPRPTELAELLLEKERENGTSG